MNRNRAFFLLVLAVVATLSLLVALPYLQYILLGTLLAYVLHPVHLRLAPRVGPRLSAGALIVATVFVVLLPFVVLLSVVAGQALTVATAIRNGRLHLDVIEAYVQTYFGITVDVRELLRSLTADGRAALFDSVFDIFGGISNAAIGLAVLLFVLYYLLKDGRQLVAWVRAAAPLPADVQDDLFAHLDRLMWAVLVGNVLVALVQGVLTGLGFVAVGLPNAVFWTVMTIGLSLLPLIGASVVWFPASLYLFFVGDLTAGAALFVYGALVVSLSDNYLRPLIGGHEAHLNPGLFIVGIFGGIGAFGFVGLFYGPIVLGALKALVDSYNEVGGRLELMDSVGESSPRE
ncbi:Predicted PurR-regulated permease PerM [Halogranum amylolyticum]|uniref:Predicted PurR-regulated permease PerM n=1 Tax=Halogranum amylolyticum TaxID=660520 RepID=A0A1H8W8S0_9EURY|nr:AI-2E family transporter [Halogranum amylolyticum]SEP24044.1 Predicted PurR-regulated permease PerM [Halogranum amylolyticum]